MNPDTDAPMCTTQARERSSQGAVFVDLRASREVHALAFAAPEVINLPMADLPARWNELPRDRELVLVCSDGRDSTAAAAFLRAHGLKRVQAMRGGVLLWMKKGYPVVGRRYEPDDACRPATDSTQLPHV